MESRLYASLENDMLKYVVQLRGEEVSESTAKHGVLCTSPAGVGVGGGGVVVFVDWFSVASCK